MIVEAHYRAWRKKMVTLAYHSGVFAQADFKKMPKLEALLSQADGTPAKSEKQTAANLKKFFAAKKAARDGNRRARQS